MVTEYFTLGRVWVHVGENGIQVSVKQRELLTRSNKGARVGRLLVSPRTSADPRVVLSGGKTHWIEADNGFM